MSKCLIVVDLQKDFCKNGALAVPNADEIVPVINKLLPKFDLIIFTKDWHVPEMEAFASQHEGAKPFDKTEDGIILWPDHCIQGTPGADLHPDIDFSSIKGDFYIFKKGFEKDYHPYSAFASPGLCEFLEERKITKVFVSGLATDYCCRLTAIDSVNNGYDTAFLIDAVRAITPEGEASTIEELTEHGVKIIESWELPLFNLL